jgi:hypothetical protein
MYITVLVLLHTDKQTNRHTFAFIYKKEDEKTSKQK